MKPEQHTPQLTFPSMAAAANASGIPYGLLKSWKAGGLPGFDANGRVNLSAVLAGVFTSDNTDLAAPAGMRNWREALLKFQAGRQELKLEQERGRLVERAWVAAAIGTAASALKTYRLTSEAEHPTRFAAAAGDVAECRTAIKTIWDEIYQTLQDLANHLEESPNAQDENQTPPAA